MSEALTTARPYAQAAFEEAQKLGDLKGWSEILLALAETVSYPEVRDAVTNPRVARTQIEKLLEATAGTQIKPQQHNFIRILVENKRALLLPEIVTLFEALKAEAERTVNVEVDSAFELSVAQQDRIAGSLKKRLGREVKLVCKVNKDLLGGAVIRTGDKVIDGSARTRLNEMASALA